MNEAYDVYDEYDLDYIPKDEKEIRLKDTIYFPIRFKTWYNLDNQFNEILYFF